MSENESMSDEEGSNLQDIDQIPDQQSELFAEYERRRRVIDNFKGSFHNLKHFL